MIDILKVDNNSSRRDLTMRFIDILNYAKSARALETLS